MSSLTSETQQETHFGTSGCQKKTIGNFIPYQSDALGKTHFKTSGHKKKTIGNFTVKIEKKNIIKKIINLKKAI